MDTLAECAQSKAEEQNCGENRFGEMHIDLLSDGSIRLTEESRSIDGGIERQALSSRAYNASGNDNKQEVWGGNGGASGIATCRCYVRRLVRFCLARVLLRDNGSRQPLRLAGNVYR